MTTCVPSVTSITPAAPGSPPQEAAFHDLDLFYIRQLARNSQDHDLERRIAVEQRLREGSSRLLAACSAAGQHLQQRLEAAKTLLTSDLRMTTYLQQLQRAASPAADGRPALIKRRQHQGRLCLSEMRLPLIWRGDDHFRDRGDGRRFAVFCMLRVGDDVCDTTLANPVDRSLTDVCFDDVIVFERVPPTFSVTLEVYSHALPGDGIGLGPALAAGTRRLKQSLHSSLTRSAGRRAAAAINGASPNHTAAAERSGPQFRCIARTTLTVGDVDDTVRCHDLTLAGGGACADGGGAKADLPLFGQVCCRLAAQSNLHMCEAACGAVAVRTGAEACCNYWGFLRGYQIRLWPSEECCRTGLQPSLIIPITKETVVSAGGAACELQLETSGGGGASQMALSLPTEDDRDAWRQALETAVADNTLWCAAAEHQMLILSPSARLSAPRPRLRSLYERVSLQEDAASPELPPPPPPPRPRALSTSAAGKLAGFIRWGSLRSRRKLHS